MAIWAAAARGQRSCWESSRKGDDAGDEGVDQDDEDDDDIILIADNGKEAKHKERKRPRGSEQNAGVRFFSEDDKGDGD